MLRLTLPSYGKIRTANTFEASSVIKHTVHGGGITDDVKVIRSLMNMSYDIKRWLCFRPLRPKPSPNAKEPLKHFWLERFFCFSQRFASQHRIRFVPLTAGLQSSIMVPNV